MRRYKHLWKKLALLIGGLVVGLFVAEITLRVLGVGFPLPYTTDDYAGSRLRPGFEGWHLKEGRAYFHVNLAGFRDRDHAISKPKGTFRIAVLGDSFAEALQVEPEQAFWSVLERKLVECPALSHTQVEVLNFGISGYGTAQELETLSHHVWQYAPDLVLLVFFAGNDVRNNSRQLEPEKLRPFYYLDNGQLMLDASFREHPDFRKAQTAWVKFKVSLINASRLLQVLNEARNGLKQGDAAGRHAGLDAGAFSETADPVWREAWEITDRLILRINEQVNEHGARFHVVVAGTPIQVHPDPEVRRAYISASNLDRLDSADRRIEALGQRAGFPVTVLSESMQRYAEDHNVFLHGFENTTPGEGHWNPAGHRLAGEIIAKDLCDGLDQ